MREAEFRMDRLGCTTFESGPLSAESSKVGVEEDVSRPANCTDRAVNPCGARMRPGQVAAFLAGSLLLILTMLGAPAVASARVAIGISVSFGPPVLPYYNQPLCPAPGYIWTPGYWAWAEDSGYYWVPGAWVRPPFIGALWTPGYWDYDDDAYRWRPGYWGRSVGYYGGIDYGYGYTGRGYYGGYWNHDRFYYNRSVNRIDSRYIRHSYDRRVDDHFRDRRESYRGGPGRTFDRAGRRPEDFRGSRNERQNRAANGRGFQSFSAPRHSGPYARREMRAPQQQRSERATYRNSSRGGFQRSQHQARPREARGSAGHAAPERHGSSQRHAERGGGNGHGRGGERR